MRSALMSFIACTVILLPFSAFSAVPNCGSHYDIVRGLGERFQEAPSAIGPMPTNQILQIFRSVDGSTWSAVVINPDGRACIVAAGDDWQDLEWIAPGPGV